MTRSARWRSPSGCSVPRRSSSSITPTAECSPSPTTSSRADPGRDRHQAAVGGRSFRGSRRGRSPVDRPHQGEARSFRRSTRFGDSSTTCRTGGCVKSSRAEVVGIWQAPASSRPGRTRRGRFQDWITRGGQRTFAIQCLCVDARDPASIASFWESVLGSGRGKAGLPPVGRLTAPIGACPPVR